MGTISEIKDTTQKKIAGQGSQVDIGNGLPSVLNGMADLLKSVQDAMDNGYRFLLFDFEAQTLPEIPDDGKYLALMKEAGTNSLTLYKAVDKTWEAMSRLYYYDSAEEIQENSEETDGYITPKGFIDYIAQNLIVDMTGMVGLDVDDALVAKLKKCLAIKEGNNIMLKITYYEPLLEKELDNAFIDCMFGYYRTEEGSGDGSIGGKRLAEAEVAYLQLGNTWDRFSY